MASSWLLFGIGPLGTERYRGKCFQPGDYFRRGERSAAFKLIALQLGEAAQQLAERIADTTQSSRCSQSFKAAGNHVVPFQPVRRFRGGTLQVGEDVGILLIIKSSGVRLDFVCGDAA